MTSTTMSVTYRGGSIQVDGRLFVYLLENSTQSMNPLYSESLKSGKIALSNLIDLSRNAGYAYSLFFGSYEDVKSIIDTETRRLYRGFEGKYSITVRGGIVKLSSIRLLIKDVKNKQDFIARFVKADENRNVKYLKHSPYGLDDQAKCVIDRLGIDMDLYRSFSNKSSAMWYLIERIEDNNIFVSLENTGTNMPQNFKYAEGLSGVYINHSKFPYFFVSNDGLSDYDRLPGRKAFTLIFLCVCMFKGVSKMVSLGVESATDAPHSEIYQITEMILMPAHLIPHLGQYKIKDVDEIANSLNVTSMAVLVRIWHLGYIEDKEEYSQLKRELSRRYSSFKTREKEERERKQRQFMHNSVRNIRAYQGKAFLRILSNLYGAKKIQRREVNRQLAYGKGTVQIQKVFEKL